MLLCHTWLTSTLTGHHGSFHYLPSLFSPCHVKAQTFDCCMYAGHSQTLPGLQALVESFRARQPELVQQVESLMTELEYMSVLWTEQWHIALLELQVRALTSSIPATGLALPN